MEDGDSATNPQTTDAIASALQLLAAVLQQQQQSQGPATPPSPNHNPGTNPHPIRQNPMSGNAQQKVNWSLLKTLCPDKLDMDTFTALELRSWQRSFLAFARETDLESYSWEIQQTTVETAMKPSTFS